MAFFQANSEISRISSFGKITKNSVVNINQFLKMPIFMLGKGPKIKKRKSMAINHTPLMDFSQETNIEKHVWSQFQNIKIIFVILS